MSWGSRSSAEPVLYSFLVFQIHDFFFTKKIKNKYKNDKEYTIGTRDFLVGIHQNVIFFSNKNLYCLFREKNCIHYFMASDYPFGIFKLSCPYTCTFPTSSLRANPLAWSLGQVKLDLDKWKLWKNLFE